jgi:hypothetical protein
MIKVTIWLKALPKKAAVTEAFSVFGTRTAVRRTC